MDVRQGADSARHRFENASTAAVVAIHLSVTLPLAFILNIWIDEAYSLTASTGELSFVLRQARDVEMQPPLYFVLLWAWRLVNPSIEFARLLSVVCAAGALVVVHGASRRWLRDVSPVWVVAPLALNRYVVYAATEIRPYSLILLLSAVLLILLHDGFFNEPRRRGAQLAYSVVALASLATYYYLGFLLAAGAVGLFVARRWRALRDYMIWMVVVGVIFLPLFLQTSGQIEASNVDAGRLPGLVHATAFVAVRILSFPFGLLTFSSAVRMAIVGGLSIAILSVFWTQRKRINREIGAMWAVLAVVAGFYVLVVRFVLGDILDLRHMLVALVPAVLSMAGVAALSGRGRRVALSTWALAAVALSVITTAMTFSPLAKGGDFRRVAAYVEANIMAGQSVAIVNANAEAPFSYYFQGAPVVAIPKHDALDSFDPANWRLESEEQVRVKLEPALSSAGEIWVVTDFIPGDHNEAVGMDLQFHYLDDVIAKDYDVISRRDFYGACVRLIKRKA